MKKLLTFAAIAALAAACCSKPVAPLTVANFFENPAAFVGQDTTLTGTILSVCDSTGAFVLGMSDTSKQTMMVIPTVEDIKVCKGCIGKEVSVKGLISETVVDAEYITTLENEANATECPVAKENKLKKAAEYREVLSTGNVFSIYSIAATVVTAKECAAKEEGCCKADSTAKEGCCKTDSTAQCGEQKAE